MGPESRSKRAPSGDVHAARNAGAGAEAGGRRARSAARTSAAADAIPAATHPKRRRRLGAALTAPRAEESRPEIHWSSLATSRALCQRSSGSLARHVVTIRSSAGGVSGWRVEGEAGSELMIAEISEAWLVPENAFFPVVIS